MVCVQCAMFWHVARRHGLVSSPCAPASTLRLAAGSLERLGGEGRGACWSAGRLAPLQTRPPHPLSVLNRLWSRWLVWRLKRWAGCRHRGQPVRLRCSSASYPPPGAAAAAAEAGLGWETDPLLQMQCSHCLTSCPHQATPSGVLAAWELKAARSTQGDRRPLTLTRQRHVAGWAQAHRGQQHL